MSTGNTGSCIRSILWKPYRVRRRKERRKEHRGGLPGALMRMESGHGAEFGNWKQQNLRFWDGSAIPFCFSSANLFYSWETVFYNEKRSASRVCPGEARVLHRCGRCRLCGRRRQRTPDPCPAFCAVQAVRQHPAAGFGHLLETSFFSIQFIRKPRKKCDTLWAVTDRNG